MEARFLYVSPESNNSITCKNGISPRPYLDRDLYNRHIENHKVEKYPLPSTLYKYLDTDSLIQFKKEMRKNSSINIVKQRTKTGYKAYEAPINHDSDEDAFNQLFKWSYLHLIGKSINTHVCKGYYFASVEKFSRVKVFFLHAADFEDRVVFLPQLIKFCWNTKCLVEQAVNNIAEVNNKHQKISSKYRYNPEMTINLRSIINPVILKLTKEEDSVGMGNLGPIYSPPHY
ncbi:MAG: hypothetical protein EXX96DRAFT_624831 [Benjaminiella poitrasii]|nr:MAG: hypothetical protein EXX96DRAFT_624831 [Benjaminiella poitrasii]